MSSFHRLFLRSVVVGIRYSSTKPTIFTGSRVWKVRYEDNGQVVPTEEGEKTLPVIPSYVNVDFVLKVSKEWDISWKGIKNWYKRLDLMGTYHDQRFIQERIDILGADLAAAHFIVARGGAARFVGQNKWVRRNEKGDYILPRKYVPGVTLEALDLQTVPIIYEGMINLVNLRGLRWLSFRGSKEFDDWFCDWLGRYSETLEYLDIGGCKEVTERGVGALHRLRNLKTLVLDDLPKFNHRQLVCLMLNDVIPDCKIIGVDGIVDLHLLELAEPEAVVQVKPQHEEEQHQQTVVKV